MLKSIFAVSQNTMDGLIIGAKLIGAILISAILLFAVLKLIRLAGKVINRALYKRYLSKIPQEEPRMTFDEFVRSISAVKIYDKQTIDCREQSSQKAEKNCIIEKSDTFIDKDGKNTENSTDNYEN